MYFEGSQPERCISSMIYRRDTPFWSETLDLYCCEHGVFAVMMPDYCEVVLCVGTVVLHMNNVLFWTIIKYHIRLVVYIVFLVYCEVIWCGSIY